MGLIRKGILAIIFLFLMMSLFKNINEFRKNLQFYNSYQNQLKQAQQENARLLTQKTLKTSPREVEKTIRNQLNLLKEGEIAVIVPPPTPTPTPIITPIPPVYRQWWNTFFSLSR
jgi:cell division protein FtsB